MEVRLHPQGGQKNRRLVQDKKRCQASRVREKGGDAKPEAGEADPNRHGILGSSNRRLDHVKAYNSASHYKDHVYMAKRWANVWKSLICEDISLDMVPEIHSKTVKSISLHCQP